MDQSMQPQMVAEQTARVSPTLIMVNQLLALSSQELVQMVHAELEQNPALESTENSTCPSCGTGTTGIYCPNCMQPVRPGALPDNAASGAITSPANSTYDDGYDPEDYRPRDFASYLASEDDYDPLTLVASEASMAEQLLADLLIALPREDHPIAAYLVGNLDDQGFLGCTVEAAAEHLSVNEKRVERVLSVLQITAPAGVGARNLRECLLIQLEELRAVGAPVGDYVQEVVSEYLTELGEHKFTIIAQALGTTYDKVVAARDFIKQNLQPRPLQEPPQGHAWRSPSPTRFVIPDVIIRERDGQLEAEVVETSRFSLRINPLYQRLATSEGRDAAESVVAISQVEREHIKRYVNRSKLFISNIKQRRETMHRITTCLILLQEDFIRHGVRSLRPLTRAQVAQYLGIHESTVSRATANKYVMLPSKHVIPFSDFFSASLSAKDVIKELILNEAAPMTDKDIVSHLRDQGIRVARRTVTKYRNQLGIMPSTFR
ncbi:MAG: RNA polymerase factor sigma-54 [Chloroflexia bacterium]